MICESLHGCGRLLAAHGLGKLLQSLLQLQGKLLIALLAHRLHIELHKLVFQCELGVAGGTGEAVDAPSLVQSRHDIAFNHTVAVVADISKKLVVVSLAVRQTFPLIMAMTQERLLTLGTHKMFNMPLLAHGVDHAAFDRPSACSTDWHTHFIVAWKAV